MRPNLAYYPTPRSYDQLTWVARKPSNPFRRPVGLNRSGNQSTPVSAPDSRSLRPERAAETADPTPASDDQLTAAT